RRVLFRSHEECGSETDAKQQLHAIESDPAMKRLFLEYLQHVDDNSFQPISKSTVATIKDILGIDEDSSEEETVHVESEMQSISPSGTLQMAAQAAPARSKNKQSKRRLDICCGKCGKKFTKREIGRAHV